MSKWLGQIVENICGEFMDYFKASWYPRIGNWTNALKSLSLASQETYAGVEFYHNQMKLRLFNEKDPSVYQQTDWLVNKLGTKVYSYFDEYPRKEDFKRYWKEEWLNGLTSWCKALKISDYDVVMEGKYGKVTDQIERDRAYIVWNPGSQFGGCDCKWAEKGNLCEHMLSVSVVKKNSDMPSVTLRQFHQALVNMLHCPLHDSLIRDHAVSLEVFIQKHINVTGDLESRNSAEPNVASGVCEQNIFHDSVQIRAYRLVFEKYCMNGHEASKQFTVDGRREPNGPIGSGNGISCESSGEEIACTEMDVDPSSI